MALAKKGCRNIQVAGKSYRWKFRKYKDWCPCACNHGSITIAIEPSKGGCLTSFVIGKEPQPEKRPITPKVVRQLIFYALQNGWNPDSKTSKHFAFYDFQGLFADIG
jgi:hypothetical protein